MDPTKDPDFDPTPSNAAKARSILAAIRARYVASQLHSKQIRLDVRFLLGLIRDAAARNIELREELEQEKVKGRACADCGSTNNSPGAGRG